MWPIVYPSTVCRDNNLLFQISNPNSQYRTPHRQFHVYSFKKWAFGECESQQLKKNTFTFFLLCSSFKTLKLWNSIIWSILYDALIFWPRFHFFSLLSSLQLHMIFKIFEKKNMKKTKWKELRNSVLVILYGLSWEERGF